MRRSNIETLKSWINTHEGTTAAAAAAAAEPQATTLNSKQRNYLKWQSRLPKEI